MPSTESSPYLYNTNRKNIMRTPRYITILLVLLITTVAGGAVLLPDSDITNDCGESLYLIQSQDCEGEQVRSFVWASRVTKVRIGPEKGSCARSCRCGNCEVMPRKI